MKKLSILFFALALGCNKEQLAGFETKARSGVSLMLVGTLSVQKAKLEFVNGAERMVKYFTDPVGSIDISSDSLLGKKWNTKATVWFVQDSCFQRVSRLTTSVDFTNSNSVVLPSLLDPMWQQSFYSEHFSIGGDSTIAIYRTIKADTLLIEMEGPPNYLAYYAYADEGFWDSNWQPVCGMTYQEIFDPSPFSIKTNIKILDQCSASNKKFIDDLIMVDGPGFPFFNDYFVWTIDGRPYCPDNNKGAIVQATSRSLRRASSKNQ